MDSSQLLSTLLVSVGYRLPILIALAVALMMVLDTPRGSIRTAALSGLSLQLGCGIVGGLLAVWPLLLIAKGSYGSLGAFSTLMNIAQFAVALVQAAGFVLLAWALSRALRLAGPQAKA